MSYDKPNASDASDASNTTDGLSSASAVRGPQAATGAVDRAHLSEEVARGLAAEGHRDEAIAVYRLLLSERPGDADLRRRLDEVLVQSDEERGRRERPRMSPSATGPYSEPFGMLDLIEPPETYDVDEVEVLYKDPWWVFVYWEVTDAGLRAARAQLGAAADGAPDGAGARLVLRLFSTPVTGVGQSSGSREHRDISLQHSNGRRYLEVPRPGGQIRAAVGLLSGEGFFAPIAHSLPLRLPPPSVATQVAREWLDVAPPHTRGLTRERISTRSPAEQPHERALAWRLQRGAGSSTSEGSDAALAGALPAPEAEAVVEYSAGRGGAGSGRGQ